MEYVEFPGERFFMIKGEATRQYKNNLKAIYGSWNNKVHGEHEGWVFGLKQKEKALALIEQFKAGTLVPADSPPRVARAKVALYNEGLPSGPIAQPRLSIVPRGAAAGPSSIPVGTSAYKKPDGATYRTYPVEIRMPDLGQTVTITNSEGSKEYKVVPFPGQDGAYFLAREGDFCFISVINGVWVVTDRPGCTVHF
jgi:hypothetical protein